MIISAAGRDVEVSSPDKVFFADRGETKLDLVNYYLAMAEPVMRQMRDRPVMMQRFPDGDGKPLALVAHTVKGKGVSFMEDDNNWHYRIPTEDEVRKSKIELGLV